MPSEPLRGAMFTVLEDDTDLFRIPPGWKRIYSNVSVEDSVAMAQAVVESILPLFNTSSGFFGQYDFNGGPQTAELLEAISLLDHKANTDVHRDFITHYARALTPAALIASVDQPFLKYPIEWGLSAIRGYRTYNDTTLLSTATGVWDQAILYFVTPNDAASGVHPRRNVSIMQGCPGGSTAGAVLRDSQNLQDTQVNTDTIGAFSALSGLLFEATQDPKYQSAAELSAQFIRNHLWEGQIIRDTFDIRTCDFPTEFKLCANSGKTFEATSILATQNHSWDDFLHSLVASATAFETWTGENGVNTEGEGAIGSESPEIGQTARKVFFIRGLYEIWERNLDTAMANYIEAYLNVQFNALRDLASAPGSDEYSPTWTARPTATTLLPWGQLDALDVLSSQVGFARRRVAAANNGTSVTISTSAPSATSAGPALDKSKLTHTGAIVGAAVGAAGTILIISVGLWYFLRKRRRARDLSRSSKETVSLPFQGRLSKNQHPTVVPYNISEYPITRGATPIKGSGKTTDFGDQGSNNILTSSSFSPPVAPFTRNDTEGPASSQGPLLEERRSYDSEIRRRTVGMDGATSPELVELLQAIVARLPPENVHQTPPSYYTD